MSASLRLARLAAGIVGIGVVLMLPWIFSSPYDVVLLNMALMYSVIVLGLNFVYGYTGILSLAQAAFWGIGAYTSALLTVDYNVPVWIGLAAAGIVTTLFGVLLGYPTLRLKTHYLLIATLGFAEAVRLVLMNFQPLTHGAQGIRNIPQPALGPIAIDSPHKFYYLNLIVLTIAILFGLRLVRSRIGRALRATRDDELAASASGVNVTYTRVLAFAISAFWAGIAGALWAHFSGFISPETFDLMAMIRFASMLVIGGTGSIVGSIVGAFILTYLPEWLKFLEGYYMAIYGLSLVVFLVAAPMGLAGLVARLPVFLKTEAKNGELTGQRE